MTRATLYDNAIQRGMAYIQAAQLPGGSFDSFSSSTRSPFTMSRKYSTTFTPAIMLAALCAVDSPQAQTVRDKLSKWLITQKSPAWSFNYWSRDSPERHNLPYPDDLDDTFCALLALRLHNPSLIDEAALAKVVKLLIATESQVGGPYKTWLAAANLPDVWHDIDLAVNSNVAGFLRLVAEPLPNITHLIEQAIISRTFSSPYYPSSYPVMYYITRAYDGPLCKDLADHIISMRQDGWWASPLSTALAITSLVRLGCADECAMAAKKLATTQQSDGSWPAEVFCIDPTIDGQPHYSGAAALTTACAVEALALMQPSSKPHTNPRERTSNEDTVQMNRRVAEMTHQDTQRLGVTLKKQMQAALKYTHASDEDYEITLLPYFFNKCLVDPLPKSQQQVLVHLGAANAFGWAAYTIYDDLFDGETEIQNISPANTAMRDSLEHFRLALPHDTEFQTFVSHAIDIIDDANAWEMAYCRMPVSRGSITLGKLPRYKKTLSLADRSIGHILTPVGVLAAAGIPPSDPRSKHVALALRHYITARQIHDDIHDWEDDLRAGIITYAVAKLLQETAIPAGTHKLAKLIPKLQRQFWHQTLPGFCATITRHTTLARRASTSSGLLIEPNIVTLLTKKLDDSAEHTLTEQKKAEEFLTAYKGRDSVKSV